MKSVHVSLTVTVGSGPYWLESPVVTGSAMGDLEVGAKMAAALYYLPRCLSFLSTVGGLNVVSDGVEVYSHC